MRNEKKLKKVIFLLKYEMVNQEICEELNERLNEAGVEVAFMKEGKPQAPVTEGILYVTDCPAVAAEHDKEILIYLHDKNSNMDFSGCTYFIEGFEDADAGYFGRIYERLNDIPWVIAETSRLRIREMAIEDLDAIHRLYEKPELIPFLPPLREDSEEEREYLQRYIRNMYGIFGYGMWLLETYDGEVVGRMGVENTEEEDLLSFGFLIHPKDWRKGYATEAGKAVLEYLREEFPHFRIAAFCHPQNLAARGLCDKLGICVKSIK